MPGPFEASVLTPTVSTVRIAYVARRAELSRIAVYVLARREPLALASISLAAAAIFYLPFVLHLPSIGGIPFGDNGMDRIYGMWDGPAYVTVAATLWDPDSANPVYAWWSAPPSDYAERFPLYPLAIRALSPALGYWDAALALNVAVSTTSTVLLYLFLRRYSSVPSSAFWLALVAIFWPPRAFLYRYVGMADPLFALSVLAAAYAWKARRLRLCGLAGAAAVATRPNGFLIIVGFGLLAIGAALPVLRRFRAVGASWQFAWLLLMPAVLMSIAVWHQRQFGDWLASVHSPAFVVPQAGLFPSLAYFGVGEEGVAFLFVLVLAGGIELLHCGHMDLALMSGLFYLPALMVPTDVSRYLLPVLPFVFFLAGARLIATPPIRIAALVSIPVVYAYAWSTLLNPGYQAPFEPLRALLS